MSNRNIDAGALIAVDWGTSRLRALLLASDGRVIEERDSDDGIGSLSGGHEEAFERLVLGWPMASAIMAGMVGSRQGWREAPYVSLPATVPALAAKLDRFVTDRGRSVAIVPGVMLRSNRRDGDVIRGEETQIIGLLDREPGFAGVAILPGTHSKWVSVANGAITDFQTYLTGEMFDLLAHRSFLRHSVGGDDASLSERPGFALGIKRTAAEGLPFLAAVFSVRARALLDQVDPADNLAYLSGLVIGGEIAAAAAGGSDRNAEIRIIGAKSLARAYARAFDLLGRKTGSLDGTELVTAGLVHLARAIGLIPGNDRP
jgi:2-dehydro-3-deoxygalactonokinase